MLRDPSCRSSKMSCFAQKLAPEDPCGLPNFIGREDDILKGDGVPIVKPGARVKNKRRAVSILTNNYFLCDEAIASRVFISRTYKQTVIQVGEDTIRRAAPDDPRVQAAERNG